MCVLGWVEESVVTKGRFQSLIFQVLLEAWLNTAGFGCWVEQMEVSSVTPLRRHGYHQGLQGTWLSTSQQFYCQAHQQPKYTASIIRKFWQEVLNTSVSSQLKYFSWIWKLSGQPACASIFFPQMIISEVFWMRSLLKLTAQFL